VARWPAAEGGPNSSKGFVAQEEPRFVTSPFPFPGTRCIAAGEAGEAVVCTACLGIEVDQTPWTAVPMALVAVAVAGRIPWAAVRIQ